MSKFVWWKDIPDTSPQFAWLRFLEKVLKFLNEQVSEQVIPVILILNSLFNGKLFKMKSNHIENQTGAHNKQNIPNPSDIHRMEQFWSSGTKAKALSLALNRMQSINLIAGASLNIHNFYSINNVQTILKHFYFIN